MARSGVRRRTSGWRSRSPRRSVANFLPFEPRLVQARSNDEAPFASIVALFATSLLLQRPVPVAADEGMVVQATSDGIQLRNGERALMLRIAVDPASHISYTSDAQGAVGVRTVDPKTDFVTISRVYAD